MKVILDQDSLVTTWLFSPLSYGLDHLQSFLTLTYYNIF